MEYAAVIVLVAAIAAAFFLSGLPRVISDGVADAVGKALDGGATASGGDPGEVDPGDSDQPLNGDGAPGGGTPGGGTEALPLLDGSEGYEAQPLLYQPEAGNGVTPTHGSYDAVVAEVGAEGGNRRDDGYETELTEDGTGGSGPDEDFDEIGLGPLVEGSSTGEEIDPLEWEAPDGHNEHGSVEVTEEHEDSHRTWAQIAAMAGAIRLDNASKNMTHFLANSGEPLEQDVDDMLNSVDRFSAAAEVQQQDLLERAIRQADEEGGNGPYTFPVRTDWSVHVGDKEEDGMDWYYGSGSWSYSQTGEITVTREDDGSWSYDMETQVHMRDQYDWHGDDDGGLGVTIPFLGQVNDEELAELTRAGLAQEYTMYGTSDSVTRSGSYDSDEGPHDESSSGPGTR